MAPKELLEGVQEALSKIELGPNDRIELRFPRKGTGQIMELASLGGSHHGVLMAMCSTTGKATLTIVEDERPGVPIRIQGKFSGLDTVTDAKRIQAISLAFEAATNFLRTHGFADCTIDYRHLTSTLKPNSFRPRIDFTMDGMPFLKSDVPAAIGVATTWDFRTVTFE